MELDTGKIEEMKISLIEACINAIEHSKSEERRVYINFDVGEDALTIRIGDKGHGFSSEEAQKKSTIGGRRGNNAGGGASH